MITPQLDQIFKKALKKIVNFTNHMEERVPKINLPIHPNQKEAPLKTKLQLKPQKT